MSAFGKEVRRFLLLFFIIIISLGFVGCTESDDDQASDDSNKNLSLTILTSNDRHSSFLAYPYDPDSPSASTASSEGSIARAASLIKLTRSTDENVFLIDAGDFIDRTILISGENGAADFNLMKKLGYTAATLGNHELGMGPDGLASMIINAEKNADGSMVPLLNANIIFSEDSTADDILESLYGSEGEPGKYIFPYIIRTTASGIKTAIFGLMGKDIFMPDAEPITFDINYAEIQALVDKLRNDEKAEVVICTAHASFNVNNNVPTGELSALARNVIGIDLIIAGHSHSVASALVPSEVSGSDWTTAIIEAGDKSKKLGEVNLTVTEGAVNQEQTTLSIHTIDEAYTDDTDIRNYVGDLISDVETSYLNNFPTLGDGTLFTSIASSSFSLSRLNSMNLVSDSMRVISGADVAFVTPGADGADLVVNTSGEINLYDTFTAMPHGMGRDGLHGGPLYKFYLVAEEVRSIMELSTCNMGVGSPDLFIVPSGLRIVYDTSPLASGGQGYILQMYDVSTDESIEELVYDRTNAAWEATGWWKSGEHPYELLAVSTSILTIMGLKEVGSLYDLWPRTNMGAQVIWDNISEMDPFVVKGDNSGTAYEIKTWYGLAQFVIDFDSNLIPEWYNDNTDDAASKGPSWRRVWNVAEYGQP